MRYTMYLVACSCNTIDCLRKESFKRQLKQLLKINDKKKKWMRLGITKESVLLYIQKCFQS